MTFWLKVIPQTLSTMYSHSGGVLVTAGQIILGKRLYCATSAPDEMGRSYKIVAGVAWSMKVEASGRSTPSLDL